MYFIYSIGYNHQAKIVVVSKDIDIGKNSLRHTANPSGRWGQIWIFCDMSFNCTPWERIFLNCASDLGVHTRHWIIVYGAFSSVCYGLKMYFCKYFILKEFYFNAYSINVEMLFWVANFFGLLILYAAMLPCPLPVYYAWNMESSHKWTVFRAQF